MATVYVSSTIADLNQYRTEVVRTLRDLGHTVVAQENYVADDRVPLDRCVEDVAGVDVYVGILAWRYGFVPPGSDVSITEAEYRAAEDAQIPRLMFLLDASVAWPPNAMDAFTGDNEVGQRITAFREEVSRTRLISFFRTPDDLARSVSVALSVRASRVSASSIPLAGSLADVDQVILGSSLTHDIADALTALLRSIEHRTLVQIDLRDGEYWWSTRLFLTAVLLHDYTSVSQVVLVHEGERFFGFVSPADLSRCIGRLFPDISRAYAETLQEYQPQVTPADQVFQRVQDFSIELGKLPGGEAGAHVIVSSRMLEEWLGSNLRKDSVPHGALDLNRIALLELLDQRGPMVALLEGGILRGVVNRYELASMIARSAVDGAW